MKFSRMGFQAPRAVRLIVAALAGLAVMLGVSTVAATPASADATTCAFFGTGIKGLIRNGQFCGGIKGRGTDIDTITGNFGMTIPGRDVVCNPSLKMDVFDRWDRWITSRQGAQMGGCYWGAFNFPPSIRVNWGFPQADGGRVYVTLQSSGSPVSTVSFYFHS